MPEQKATVENFVATQFAIDSRAYDLRAKILSAPVQNDIDFTIETDLGPMGLELVEYAPVGKSGFSGPKPTDFSPIERAREVIGLIAK